MEAKTVLVADYANVAEGGKANVMGIFRTIYSSVFPARHPEMFLVVVLQASVAEQGQNREIVVKLLNEDASKELVNYSQQFTVPTALPGHKPEINIFLRLRDIIFEKPGDYFFSILVGNYEKATYTLEVTKTETPPA